MSCTHARRIEGYPKQRLFELFACFNSFDGTTEKLNIIFEDYFDRHYTKEEQQKLLDHHRKKTDAVKKVG